MVMATHRARALVREWKTWDKEGSKGGGEVVSNGGGAGIVIDWTLLNLQGECSQEHAGQHLATCRMHCDQIMTKDMDIVYLLQDKYMTAG